MLKGLQQFLRPCHCHHDHRHFDKELLNFSTKSCFHTQFNFLGKYTRVQHQYNKEKQIASFMESLPAMTTLHAANGASKNVIPVTQDSCVSSIEELLREDPLPERDSKRMPENLLSPSASRGNIPVVSQAELIRNSNKIKLTEKEREILDLLKLCCKQFNLDLTLRVAGGWVRDKILGFQSDDLDITIDKMMGYDFAVIFNEFLKKRGYPVSSIGVVGANPEQSKHLQTAIVDILNLKVDFVNMRNEMYAQDSRIPAEIAFGSAEEDSHRRDTTINSLYYNIMTGLVEDWTRLGIQDLEQGIIRTPLAARDIFADDPLRILRCLRFAARFNFKLDGEIIASLEDSQMRLSLLRKVSRERIGIEIKKMLTCSRDAGEAPIRALQFLHYLELMPIIYQVPYSVIKSGVFIAGGDPYRESFELFQIFTTHFYTKLGCLLPNLNSNSPTNTKYLPEDFHEQHQHEDVIQHQMTSLPICWPLEKHSLFLIWNALSMLPFRGQVCHMPEISKNPIPLIEYISHISLKYTNHQGEQLKSVVENCQILVDFMTNTREEMVDQDSPFDLLKLVSCLRLLGPRWEYIWFVAMPLYFRQTFPGLTSASTADINERVALVLRRFQSFREAVYYHHLDKLWRMKPILKGDQVIKLLNIKKPTQYVHRLLCELVVWQIGQMKRHLSRMPILDEKEKDSLMKDTCQEIPQIEAEKYILELDATQKHLLMSPEYPKY